MRFLAKLLYILDKRRKKFVFANLNMVFPELSEEERVKLAKSIYQNFTENIFEILKSRFRTKKQLAKMVEFEGLEHIEKLRDRPIIFISAHYGNWEMLPLMLGGVLEIPMTVVVREFKNRYLNTFFKRSRERFNIETIDKKGGLKGLIKAIKRGRSVGIFVDQNTARSEGLDVEMFGLKALQTPSAGLLAKKFNLPIVPVFIYRDGKKYKIIFKEPIFERDINKSVQLQSKAIEEMVKERPKEWFWFHRRFKHYYEDRYA